MEEYKSAKLPSLELLDKHNATVTTKTKHLSNNWLFNPKGEYKPNVCHLNQLMFLRFLAFFL